MTKIKIYDEQGNIIYSLVFENEEPAWAYHTLISNADYERVEWSEQDRVFSKVNE